MLRFFGFKSRKKQGSLASRLSADAIDALDKVDSLDLTPQEQVDSHNFSEQDLASFIHQAQTGEELPPPSEPSEPGVFDNSEPLATPDATISATDPDNLLDDVEEGFVILDPAAEADDEGDLEGDHEADAGQHHDPEAALDPETGLTEAAEDDNVILVIDDTLAPQDVAANAAQTPAAQTPAAMADLALQRAKPPKSGRFRRFARAVFLLGLISGATVGFYYFVEKGLTVPPNTAGLTDGLRVVSVTHETLNSRLGETLLINIDLLNNTQTPQKMGKIDIYLMGQDDQVLTNWQIDTSGRTLPQQKRTMVTTRLFTIPPGMTEVVAVHRAGE
ncbi:MAG: hypothetical protein ACON4W_05595 [Parvibaculales bacterium]